MSPRTPKQYEEIREEKRTLIMDVALVHFANNGFHNTTINHLARHAGISKGLMYNYFKNKDDLLSEIIERSITEMYGYFDINRDGYLTEEEFEFFIRKMSQILKEKRTFWRLFFQLLMQNEVREKFLKSFMGSPSLFESPTEFRENLFVSRIMKIITEYFIRKKERRGADYDPILDMTMFILTMKGFAITFIYLEDDEKGINFDKTVNHILELYK